jgi:hypothetical protein
MPVKANAGMATIPPNTAVPASIPPPPAASGGELSEEAIQNTSESDQRLRLSVFRIREKL